MVALQQQDGRLARDDTPQGIRTQDADRHAKCLHQIEHTLAQATSHSMQEGALVLVQQLGYLGVSNRINLLKGFMLT
jgi:hypothetical protein